MSKTETALKLALEALEKCDSALAEELSAWDIDPPLHHVLEASNACGPAITAIREALAEQPAQQQEPVELDPKDVHVEVVTKQMGGFAPVMTNGIRLTHKPTGTVVEETAERSAHRNRDVAWKRLTQLVTSPKPAQPTQQQEPVAWLIDDDYTTVFRDIAEAHRRKGANVVPLYTSPPASKPWVGLTEEQMAVLNFMLGADDLDGVWFGERHPKEKGAFWWRNRLRNAFQDAAIEAKLKEKNA